MIQTLKGLFAAEARVILAAEKWVDNCDDSHADQPLIDAVDRLRKKREQIKNQRKGIKNEG